LTYKFRVTARNSVGFGDTSEPISILTAIVPSAPTSPTTSVLANDILIQWAEPSSDSLYDYGALITSYKVLIQSNDGITFYENAANCDGTTSQVLYGTSCKVPISVLLGTPFRLSLGSSVYAKVAAINIVGSSEYSLPGNGAVITMSYPPDAPVNLLRNNLLTTKT
jgi:hypothetical protein